MEGERNRGTEVLSEKCGKHFHCPLVQVLDNNAFGKYRRLCYLLLQTVPGFGGPGFGPAIEPCNRSGFSR